MNNQLSFVDTLLKLTNYEIDMREKNMVNSMVKVGAFPHRKEIKDFDFHFQPSVNKQQILDFTTLRFLEEKENIVFLGPSGVGKTHLATSIGIAAAKKRTSTYLTFFDWLLIFIIFGSLIFIIYSFINNWNHKHKRVIQEQAKFRVMRDSEYQKLISLSPFDFEKFVADLFTTRGYDAELTPSTGDGGKDIILRKKNEITLVECKRYNQNNKVSRPEIQKFHSALMDMNAKEGYFVTTGYFTQPAMNYSLNKPIKLIDLPRLLEMIEEAKIN